MGSYDLIRFPSAEALADSVAARWLEFVEKRHSRNQPSNVAISGGRITRAFFDAFVQQAQGGVEALEGLRFFWADERCVPPDDPESNFRLAKETLLEPLGIDSTQIYRIRGEWSPEEAARQAEQNLRQCLKTPPGTMPALDLVFLGMGEDGHVASLFPDAPSEVVSSRSAYLPVIGPKPPPERITLTYEAILAAQEVWVLASGAGKEDALRRSLESEKATPLARVVKNRNHTRLFTDIGGESG